MVVQNPLVPGESGYQLRVGSTLKRISEGVSSELSWAIIHEDGGIRRTRKGERVNIEGRY